MKQLQLLPEEKIRKEHGGSLGLGRRRRRRPMNIKTPLHLVLRSDFAYDGRSLMRHRPLIQKILKKAQIRFGIRIYEQAIVSNHIHLLVKGSDRQSLQNFFRVVAGHIAQGILRDFPILPSEKPRRGGAPGNKDTKAKTRETENKFWQVRIYSRIVSWGRDYFAAKRYVLNNTLEALGLIPYKPRKKGGGAPKSDQSARARTENTS
jgi:REP element-mobilizing transposase RayT